MLREQESFSSLLEVQSAFSGLPEPCLDTRALAEERNRWLTKPRGSLGRLEELAIWYASWRKDSRPEISSPQIVVFAGNHGVTARRVSAFPVEVTTQMVKNFAAGGAAINQLARQAGARLSVCPISLDRPTADFTQGPALDEAGFLEAWSAGWNEVDADADLLVVGEMGIGNTTAASAIACALFGGSAPQWTGRGTGVSDSQLDFKANVVQEAIDANGPFAESDGLEALRRLGGREIVAMAGAILGARHRRIPVILDGFVCGAAAAALYRHLDRSLQHAVAGHRSAEAAHGELLNRIGMKPLIDLEMRLGESSGAAVAVNILKSAVACHSGMATFDEAAVSGG